MSDFDPFSLNEEKKDTEMPVFGSFDTYQANKNTKKESKANQDTKSKKETSEFENFGSFATFDSGTTNTFDNAAFPTFESFDSEQKKSKNNDEMPTFEPFGSEPKKSKDNDEMPTFEPFGSEPKKSKDDEEMSTFESFSTPSNDKKNESPSRSKLPTFDSDSDGQDISFHDDDNNEKDKEPLYASFGKSLQTIPDDVQEENIQQEEQSNINNEDNLKFPSFGSFPSFESKENSNGDVESNLAKSQNQQNTALEKTSVNSQQKTKIDQAPKRQQQEKFSMSASLSSVKSLLKQIPGPQPILDFNPDHVKVSIPPPKPFKETALANELSNYCMKVFNHPYVFTE